MFYNRHTCLRLHTLKKCNSLDQSSQKELRVEIIHNPCNQLRLVVFVIIHGYGI